MRHNLNMEQSFYAPGRVELSGNHTDHNCGKVLAAPISLGTTAVAGKRDDNTVVLDCDGFGSVIVCLDNPDAREEEKGTTQALVRGVASGFAKRGGKTGGFNAKVSSTVIPGSGLSSSASVEILLGRIFNGLYGNEFSQTELAMIGQEAEISYFGKPCGLMDQLACASAGIVKIDFKDIHNPIVSQIDTSFEKFCYSLVILNTGSSHADLTSDYALVPKEMKKVASYFGKENLRQVGRDEFYASLPGLCRKLSNDRAILRAMHFFDENKRVDLMASALEHEAFDNYLKLVEECGESSIRMLQNAYSPSDPLNQRIMLALAVSKRILRNRGACRLQGGGFAGTVQVYVPTDYVDTYRNEIEKVFGKGSTTVVSVQL